MECRRASGVNMVVVLIQRGSGSWSVGDCQMIVEETMLVLLWTGDEGYMGAGHSYGRATLKDWPFWFLLGL